MTDHSPVAHLIPTPPAAGAFDLERLVTGLPPSTADGLACVWCDADYLSVRVAHVPVGRSEIGSQVFACIGECVDAFRTCSPRGINQTDEGGAR